MLVSSDGCTMRRYRDGPKAPKIDVLARHYLWRGLSKLPDAAKHVADAAAVEKMGMWELLKLAESLKVDPDDVIRAAEQEERQLLDYSHKFPGFRGELEFDWTVAFLGQSVTRKARVVYQHTRDWEYFDLHKNAPYTGWDSSSYRVEVQAVPVEDWDGEGNPIPGTPYWVSLEDITQNDVLPNAFWEAVVEAIDAKCKVEDAERRADAKARQASLTPRSRKRH
jgi:hypothetical protein